ncbi:MAG: 2-C-methyl-D-erythritol 2,4-cyclodiphosphate synthase [Syntrophorhabdus sp. PtaB.Bin047]|jgi:2-C-methyl-D-erythritol 2,4-cyclodiphosphate synthase|nr:MAG: 2-C-methyl-D-erythritol 2,4-cyclodiphosphate synthase [Syntrophorhabdus sp. PtaB.Bin047]
MRIGTGFDVHRLTDGRRLVLGGVEIPFGKGLLGHSDGDVLLHAISDAILGALSEGDIGVHFPDTDKSIEGIDSAVILARTSAIARDRGYRVVNVDSVVVAQAPKIAPYREAMRERIAGLLSIDAGMVGLKGKTTEGLGLTGRGEGIAAHAVVLMDRI